MTRCSIINCSNTTDKVGPVNRGISFHCFPNDPHIKNKWIEATGRKKWFPTKNSRICSIHFHEDTFTGPSKYRRVISTAYPTIDVVMMSNDEKVNKIANIPSVSSTFNDDDDYSDDAESPGGHSGDRSMDYNCSRTSRKDSETQTVTYRSGDVHEGSTCNACSGGIVGFRYVCVQCAHYSLCAACESRGEHSLHYVLRIPRLAPHDEVAAMLSKIRMHLLYGLDTEEAEQETDDCDDRVVPALSEEPIKIEIKEELPDPLEHEDAFQPDDNKYTEPEYTRESTSKEQRVALVPDTRLIITETEQNYAILNNPVKVTETEPKTTKHRNIVIEPAHGSRFEIYVEPSQESEAKKRKNTTEPENGTEKHMKMHLEEQSRAIETMMEMSVDTAGQSTEGASELLQEKIKTEEKDEGSYDVFCHTSKKILEVAGPDNERYMAATNSKKKVKQNVIGP